MTYFIDPSTGLAPGVASPVVSGIPNVLIFLIAGIVLLFIFVKLR